MLRQIHGNPQLHLPQAKDARTEQRHHREQRLLARLHVHREHYKLATTIINSAELPWLRESSTPAVLDYNKPTSSTAFCPLEETKAMGIDPTDPTKTVRIGT